MIVYHDLKDNSSSDYANMSEKKSVFATLYTDPVITRSGRKSRLVLAIMRHDGTIGLPGGKTELKDVSLEFSLTRECYEEVGVKVYFSPNSLYYTYVINSGTIVLNYYSKITEPPIPNIPEVLGIIWLPIDDDDFMEEFNKNHTFFGNVYRSLQVFKNVKTNMGI